MQLAALLIGGSNVAVSASEQRRFSVEDSIALSSFVYSGSQYLPAPRAIFSPDGSQFVAVTRHGDLHTGKREVEIWLFDTAAVRRYAGASSADAFTEARLLLRFSSVSNREPLSELRWSEDSRSVLFLGADDDGASSLYRADIRSGKMTLLSRRDQNVSRYDERNGAVVYFAHSPIRGGDSYQAGGPSLPDRVVGTGRSVLELVFPNWMDEEFHTSADTLWKVEKDTAVPVLAPDRKTPVRLRDSRLILSADGRQALVTPLVKHIPKSWERYVPSYDYPGMRIVADTPETEGSTAYFRAKEYAVVDLIDGHMFLLVDSPIDSDGLLYNQALAQWNADGSRVVLSAAYPPLGASATSAEGDPILSCELAVVTRESGDFSCVRQAMAIALDSAARRERKHLVGLQWRNGDSELVARYVTASEPNRKLTTVFRQENGAWVAHDEAGAGEEDLIVNVHEALDDPPVLVASLNGGAQRELLDPNPQLKAIALGHATAYHWTDAEGNAWSGALVTPPDFSKSRRYPLVIQTHGLDPAKFLVDGPSATGYAARALAARDIVVLQVQEIRKNLGTPQEYKTGAAGYRAAIRELTSEGTVDPAKVGLITWSHFGAHAMQGLIDDPHAYAAATWAEAGYNSYGEYLMNVDYMGQERERYFRAQLGARPFGAGLKIALQNSPGFHTDQVCTPILFQFNSPPALVFGWDTYAAFRAQNKPVDFLYLRNGDHILVKPDERLLEQGMNVDWYDYWLNGHEDPDPAKADQYKRWSILKSMPACGDRP